MHAFISRLKPSAPLLLLLVGCSAEEVAPIADAPAMESGKDGRVVLGPEATAKAGIEVLIAGPASIRSTLLLRGRLVPNENLVAHIMPRFDGLAREVRKALWDTVEKDELLVVVEGNESLHPYEVRSRIAGTVVAKDVAPGEAVSSAREMFVVADLRNVWADLDV